LFALAGSFGQVAATAVTVAVSPAASSWALPGFVHIFYSSFEFVEKARIY
jgi:hypothetical protein